jgi:hypothetical protein
MIVCFQRSGKKSTAAVVVRPLMTSTRLGGVVVCGRSTTRRTEEGARLVATPPRP